MAFEAFQCRPLRSPLAALPDSCSCTRFGSGVPFIMPGHWNCFVFINGRFPLDSVIARRHCTFSFLRARLVVEHIQFTPGPDLPYAFFALGASFFFPRSPQGGIPLRGFLPKSYRFLRAVHRDLLAPFLVTNLLGHLTVSLSISFPVFLLS